MPDLHSDLGPSRRLVLRGTLAVPAAGLVTGLAACGPVRIGQPAPYTPPPPGIDDLYRPDVQSRLTSVAEVLTSGTAPQPLRELVAHLRSANAIQQEALLTGAEKGGKSSGSSSTSAGGASDGGGDAVIDGNALVDALEVVRDLTADACIQCSGSLSRVLAAIGAHCTWAAGRAAALLGDPGVGITPPPAADALRPTRTVPRSDPPSVGNQDDYQAYLTRTQADEWYAGYVEEVMAARADDPATRDALLTSSTGHRDRATLLAQMADADGLHAVAEEPVYPLPAGGEDPKAVQMLPGRISESLLIDWVSMVGAVPFARRAACVATAYETAAGHSRLAGSLAPLPSLSIPKKG